MHPAPSVILFSTLSGLGFGYLAWLGLDATPPTRGGAFLRFFLAYALAVGGLIAATFHLGHPERALRAFSQWRSSWLSREGLCAVAALVVMGLYAAALIFAGAHLQVLGWLGAALSLATVFTTAMIYAQLATVPRWNTALTPALYLTYAVTGGALLASARAAALPLLLLAAAIQILWWVRGDTAFAARGSDLGTATGLGGMGRVRSLAHPHTAPNYLLKEFVYVVGRRHVQKLRVISVLLMAVLPAALLLLGGGLLGQGLAALSHAAGVAASRWLFFAEAEHTVGLYYGAR